MGTVSQSTQTPSTHFTHNRFIQPENNRATNRTTVRKTIGKAFNLKHLNPFKTQLFSRVSQQIQSLRNRSISQPRLTSSSNLNPIEATTQLSDRLATAYKSARDSIKQPTTENSRASVISDHLPVSYKVAHPKGEVSVASWNLLAHVNRNNNYRNIKIDGTTKALGKQADFSYFSVNGRFNQAWFLSDLASELHHSSLLNTPSSFEDFINGGDAGREILAHFLEHDYINSESANLKGEITTNPETTAAAEQIFHYENNSAAKREGGVIHEILHANEINNEIKASRKASRSVLVNTLTENGKLEIPNEFYKTAIESLKLYRTLNEGALSWDARKAALEKKPELLETLTHHEILTLQECTDPEWFVSKLSDINPDRAYSFIKYESSHPECKGNDDHCVIIFDQNKWNIDDPTRDIKNIPLGHANKPTILANFKSTASVTEPNSSTNDLIIGSIHYPGFKEATPIPTSNNPLDTVKQNLDSLTLESKTPTFIAGDYNQTGPELSDRRGGLTQTLETVVPNAPFTLLGDDYGRHKQTIDLALSNLEVHGDLINPNLLI